MSHAQYTKIQNLSLTKLAEIDPLLLQEWAKTKPEWLVKLIGQIKAKQVGFMGAALL